MLSDKTLIVTGGAGTFGDAGLDLFSMSERAEIRGLIRDERKQEGVRNLPNDDCVMLCGCVREALRA